MPFASKAQQRYLYAKHPEVAEEFAEHTPKSAYSHLPEHKDQKDPVSKGPKFARDKNRLKDYQSKHQSTKR